MSRIAFKVSYLSVVHRSLSFFVADRLDLFLSFRLLGSRSTISVISISGRFISGSTRSTFIRFPRACRRAVRIRSSLHRFTKSKRGRVVAIRGNLADSRGKTSRSGDYQRFLHCPVPFEKTQLSVEFTTLLGSLQSFPVHRENLMRNTLEKPATRQIRASRMEAALTRETVRRAFPARIDACEKYILVRCPCWQPSRYAPRHVLPSSSITVLSTFVLSVLANVRGRTAALQACLRELFLFLLTHRGRSILSVLFSSIAIQLTAV